MYELPPLTQYFSAEHTAFRASLRDFVSSEITPHVNDWDEAQAIPESIYRKIAQLGVTGLGYPEEYGGTPADNFYKLILAEEIARCVLFLVADEAGFITGSTLSANGGQYMA